MQAPGVLMRPRSQPSRLVPFVAGAALLLAALPVFLITGWSMKAWLLAAVLWTASEALGLVLGRMRLGMDNTTSSGVVAFGMMFRAIVIMVVLLAVAASNKQVGLTAALLYAAAYTMQLGVSMITYFSSPEREPK
jgi:hypothetical protein